MGKIETRLTELGLVLPQPPAPVASYVPFVVTGNLVFLSGQITVTAEGIKYAGRVGETLTLEEGRQAAELCALNVIAQAKAAIGDLDRIRRWIKITVFVNAAPDFDRHPEIANGASELLVELFGEAGRHARAAVGVGSLPRNAAVEVEAVFEFT